MPPYWKLTAEQHEAMARELYRALKTGSGTVPPSEHTTFTLDDAYRVRRLLVDLLISDGGRPKGHKVGFTSPAMQAMYGMSGPDFGQLLDNMFVPAGQPVDVSCLSDSRVEPEVAFEMAAPLRGPGVTVDDVLAATARIYAAVEIIDSRVGAMRATAVDSIADNAGAGRVVLAAKGVDPASVDFSRLRTRLTVDGETLEAPTSEVMGHPASSVAWLANKLSELEGLGGFIQSGNVVMSGSPTPSVAVLTGSSVYVDIGPLGTVTFACT